MVIPTANQNPSISDQAFVCREGPESVVDTDTLGCGTAEVSTVRNPLPVIVMVRRLMKKDMAQIVLSKNCFLIEMMTN